MTTTGCEKCEYKGYVKINAVEVRACECTKRKDLIRRFKESGLPRKMANISLDDWNHRQDPDGNDLSLEQVETKEKALSYIQKIYNHDKFPFVPVRLNKNLYTSVIFTGPKNSGKSFVGCILGKKAIENGAQVRYYDWTELVTSLDRYDNKVEYEQINYDFSNCDLVFIDSVEKIDMNLAKNQLSRIFKKRMNNGMWTIVSLTQSSVDDIRFPAWIDFCEDSMVIPLL